MIDGEDKAPEYLKISSYEISQDCIKDTIYTSFAEYDEAILTHEQKIINHEGQQAVIKAKDRNNLCKSELTFIGSVLNSENDTITFLKKKMSLDNNKVHMEKGVLSFIKTGLDKVITQTLTRDFL